MSDLASLPEVLTAYEVADVLRMNFRTVRDGLLRTGKLPAVKVGRGRTAQWRISRAALEQYLKGEGAQATDKGVT